jgi:hypothetical protein
VQSGLLVRRKFAEEEGGEFGLELLAVVLVGGHGRGLQNKFQVPSSKFQGQNVLPIALPTKRQRAGALQNLAEFFVLLDAR